MNQYESYIPVGSLHRTFAFIGNLLLLGMLSTLCNQVGKPVGRLNEFRFRSLISPLYDGRNKIEKIEIFPKTL